MRSYTSDHRTPLAWRHRDITLQSPPSRSHHSPHRHAHQHRAPPSPSVTTSSSADEREEVPMVRNGTASSHHRRPGSRGTRHHPGYHLPHPHHHHHHHRDTHSQFMAGEPPFRNGGTLRSTRSVPALALATWDGEPCPVHGHGIPMFHQPHHLPPPVGNTGSLRRHGSLFDVRGAYYPPPPSGHLPHPGMMMNHPPPQSNMMDKKSFHGSLQMLASGGPVPPHLLPPLMRPRPFVFPAGAEPLPTRDPYKMRTSPASGYAGSKVEDPYSVDQVCCKGHLIVLWIILAVVTIGVILGIVLGVTIA